MKIKICGMKYPENIQEVAALEPDYLGFIFYPKSKRYCKDILQNTDILQQSVVCRKVGVFVNEDIKTVIRIATEFELDYLQLHGNETPEYCENLRLLDFKIIKAFGVDAAFDFTTLAEYQEYCAYFLLDTKSIEYGGTGQKFDWGLLKKYNFTMPLFLSGGLELQDIPTIHDLLKDVPVHALDFNSKLEIEPGRKDIQKCKDVIAAVRSI